MPTRLDLHVHTVIASSDSGLTPARLAQTARMAQLDGAAITEHNRTWDRREAQAYTDELGFRFLRGMEVTTDLGHVLVYGLDAYVGGIHIARDLRKTVKAAGGFMVAAHPFRNVFHNPRWGSNGSPRVLSVEAAAQLPLFDLVDAIEVLNGATGDLENYLAVQVARALGMRGTGGSDAHSTQGLGQAVTVFERDIHTVEDLLHELHAGRFYPAQASFNAEGTALVPYLTSASDSELAARLQAALGGS